MAVYAYVRVSTKEQNIDRQLAALKPHRIPEENIFCDYQSGKDFKRPAYQNMLKHLMRGDLLIIKSIDRLIMIFLFNGRVSQKRSARTFLSSTWNFWIPEQRAGI